MNISLDIRDTCKKRHCFVCSLPHAPSISSHQNSIRVFAVREDKNPWDLGFGIVEVSQPAVPQISAALRPRPALAHFWVRCSAVGAVGAVKAGVAVPILRYTDLSRHFNGFQARKHATFTEDAVCMPLVRFRHRKCRQTSLTEQTSYHIRLHCLVHTSAT